MLDALKFVQGAVGKKEFVPAITHFAIKDGRIHAYNGTLTLSSPIPCNLDCNPKAIPMVKAISNCQDTITLNLTDKGRLSIRSGSFRAAIECTTEEHPYSEPEGEYSEIDGKALLHAFEVVKPFISTDASRPWSMGVLYRGNSIYATNNVCLIEYWIGHGPARAINIPAQTVLEMLRLKKVPIGTRIGETTITFYYDDDRWLTSQLYSTEWPDLDSILNVASNPCEINEELFEAIDNLKPFVGKLGQLFLQNNLAHTHEDIEEGATFVFDWSHGESVWSIEMLQLLKGVATKADFNSYPKPCLFFGDNLRGAIIGMKLASKE